MAEVIVKILKNFAKIMVVIVLFVPILIIRLIRPFLHIQFVDINSQRIGHFIMNPTIYLAEKAAGHLDQSTLDLFYYRKPVSNAFLLELWRRKLTVTRLSWALSWANRQIPGGAIHEFEYVHHDRDILGLTIDQESPLQLTEEDCIQGRGEESRIGIKESGNFVCLLSRSSHYLEKQFPGLDWRYHDYRDSKIEDFLAAARFVSSTGTCVLRMGAVVDKCLVKDDPRLIDYASFFRSDFMDIYLGQTCRFYLGDSCGFNAIMMNVNKPVIIVNMIPLEGTPAWLKNSLFLPKLLWMAEENRFLRFSEMLAEPYARASSMETFSMNGIAAINNTSDEILAVTQEMMARLDGTWVESAEDKELQSRFWALWEPSDINQLFHIRIGASFLRAHRDLLG